MTTRSPGRHQDFPEQFGLTQQRYYEPHWFKVYDHVQRQFSYRISFQAWALYTTLCMYMGDDSSRDDYRRCTVSIERMRDMWGVSTSTVKRALRELRDFGLIRAQKRQASSTYTILKIREIKKKRQVKNDPSDRSQMTFQTGHKRPIYQPVFTSLSLPSPTPADGPSKGKVPSTLKRELREVDAQIKKLVDQGTRLFKPGLQTTPKLKNIENEIRLLKKKREKIFARL